MKPVYPDASSSPRNWIEETPRRPDAYQRTPFPSWDSSRFRRLPARMIWELKAPASPRSPVTSSRPTLSIESCSSSSGRLGMLSAASTARRVMRRMASA